MKEISSEKEQEDSAKNSTEAELTKGSLESTKGFEQYDVDDDEIHIRGKILNVGS